MKSILFSLLILSINSLVIDFTSITNCPCDVFSNQLDCELSSNCKWLSGVCTQIDCEKMETQAECIDTRFYCAYRDQKCERFSQCESYSYIDPMQCASIGCTVGSISQGAYQCKEITHPICSDISERSTCQMVGCSYNNGLCTTPSCSEQTQAKCNLIRGDKFLTFQFCQYDGSSCKDSEVALDSYTCTVLTSGAYYWNQDNQKCQSCSDQSSSQNLIISMIGIILLILY